MAHLNLRDRLIEATIAYVGGEGDDVAASFSRVKSDAARGRAGTVQTANVGGAEVVSLEWRPADGKLNDCELAVKLIAAPDGDAEATQKVLVDADGLVLMVEPEEGAESEERNRKALATVRERIARSPERRVPVVVQVNRRDGGDSASPPARLYEDWPLVVASVEKGEGVMEALERAVGGVVESMQSRVAREEQAARSAGAPKVEGNPLLAALRQILQTTVGEHVAQLEARLVARVEAAVARASGGGGGDGAQLAALDERIARIEGALERAASREDVSRIEGLVAEVAPRGALISEQLTAIASATEKLGTISSVPKRYEVIAALLEKLQASIHDSTEKVISATSRGGGDEVVQVLSKIVGEATQRHDAVMNELRDQRRIARDETTRAVTNAIPPVIRAVDALAAELKKMKAGESSAAVTAALTTLEEKADGVRTKLDVLAMDTTALAKRLGDVDIHIAQEANAAARRAAELVDALAAFEGKEGMHADAAQAAFGALVEEMKKKKSWFG